MRLSLFKVIIMFDYDIFNRIAIKQYNSISCPYTLNEVLSIFRYYFDTYRAYMGREHPYLKPQQVGEIIERLPICEDMYIEAEEYPTLIESYFNTDFNADYNINHFFSGAIRLMRIYDNGLY